MNALNVDFKNFYIVEAHELNENIVSYLESIISLINDAYWQQQQHFFNDTPEARTRIDTERIKKILNDPNKKLYLLIDKTKNSVAGTILLESEPEKNNAKFGLFAIAEEYQGKGLGQSLVSHVEKTAQSLGKKKMKIEVFVFAPSLAKHYERLGYSYTGKQHEFPHWDSVRPEYQNTDKNYLMGMKKKIV